MRHITKNSTLQCVDSVTENIFFSHRVAMYIYEEKIEIQTSEMYNKYTKISKTNFLY